MYMKIIFKIKEIRKEKNITIVDLHNITGISISHINNIENNYKQPTVIVLELIKKALKMKNIEELYEVKW